MLLLACTHGQGKPATKAELNCNNLGDAAGSVQLGDFLDVACGCGNGQACELMAVALEKEGGSKNLASAAEYRSKACKLGWTASCAPRGRSDTCPKPDSESR